MEGSCQSLHISRIRQQVSSQLLDGELIKGHNTLKLRSPNLSSDRRRAERYPFVAVGISVSRHV